MKVGALLILAAVILVPLPASSEGACALVCPPDTKLDAQKCVCIDARGMALDTKTQATCTTDLCPDGSPRDPKTCACPDNTK
jgi:hypothetical protein